MDFGIKTTSVIILLSFYCLSIISGINIDCNGRAFHCVNSTHFKICVDLGGGVSKTVDEFLLPCPYNTYCRETNKYECEYYETTTPSTMIAGELSVINDLVEPSVIPLSHTAQMLQVKSFANEPATLQEHASEHEDLSARDILVTSTPHVTDNQEINNIKNTNISTTQLFKNDNRQDLRNQTFKANMAQNEVKIKHEESHGAPKDNELETSTTPIDFVTNLPEKGNLNYFNTENNDTISATSMKGSNNTIKIKSQLFINKTDDEKSILSDTVFTLPTTIKPDDKHLFQNITEEYLPNEKHLKSLTTEQYKIVLKTVIADRNKNTNVDSNIPKNNTDIMISGGSDLAHTIFTTSNYDSIQLLINATIENVSDNENLNSLTTKNYKNVSEPIAESNIINGKLKFSKNKTDEIQTKKGEISYILTTTSKYNERQLLQNTTQEYLPDNSVTASVVGDSMNTVNIESILAKSNTDIILSEETDSATTISNYDIKRFLQNTTKGYFSDDTILKSLTTENYKVVSEILIAGSNSNNTINVSSNLPKNSIDIMKPRESDTIHTMFSAKNNESKTFLQNATNVYLPDDDLLKYSITESPQNAAETLISNINNPISVDSNNTKHQTGVLKSNESNTTHTTSKTLYNDNKPILQNTTILYLLDNNSVITENYENISESTVESNKTIIIKSKNYVNQDVIKTVESVFFPTSTTSHYDDKQLLPNTTTEYLSDDDYSLTSENYGNILETIAGSNITINDFQSIPTNNTNTRTSERNTTKEFIMSGDELLKSLTTENYENGSEAPIADSNDNINLDSNILANYSDKMIFSRSVAKTPKVEYDDKHLLQNITQEYLPELLESKDHGASLVIEINSIGNDTLQVQYPIISTNEQIKKNDETENIINEIASTKSYNSSFSLSHSSTTESMLVTTANIDLPYSTELSKNQLNNTNIIFDWHNSPFSILGPQTTNNSYNLSARNNIISTTKKYDENKEKAMPISQLNDKRNSVSDQLVTNVHAINENNEPSNHYKKLNSSLDKNINVDKNETQINIKENYLNLISSSSSDHSNPYNNNVLEPTTENYNQEKMINVRPDSQTTSEEYIINSDIITSTSSSFYVINTTAANILQAKNEEYLTTLVSDNLTTISLVEYNLTSSTSTETTLRENLPYVTDFENHSSNSNVTSDPIKVGNILLTNKDINEATTLQTSETKPYSASNYFWPRTTLKTNDKYLQSESTLIKTTPIEETTYRIYISNTTTKTSPSTLEPKEYLKNVMTVPNNVTKSFNENTSYYGTFTPKLIVKIPSLTINENGIFNDSVTHSMKDFATTTGDHLITSELSPKTSSVTATVIDSKNTTQKLNIEATLYTFDSLSENSFIYNPNLESINNEKELVHQNLKSITSNNAKYSTDLINNVQGISDNKSSLTLNEIPFSQQLTKDQTLEFKDPARFYSTTNKMNSSFLELNKNVKVNAVSTNVDGLIYNKSQDNNNSNDLNDANNNKINNKGGENLGTTLAPPISLNSTQLKFYNQTQGLLLKKKLSGELSNSKIYYVNTLMSYCQNQPAGKYADKNDCKKFYVCLGEAQPFIGECPNGTVFSESKKQCTKNLSQCYRNNQFKCLSPGRYYDLRIKNAYYICVKNKGNFLKFKYQCQNGYSLNKTIIQCVQDSSNVSNATCDDLSNTKEESTSISLESSSKISEESKIKETKSETEEEDEEQKEKKFECKKEGKFPHPKECNKYYLCSKTKKFEFRRKLKSCESHEVFDKEKHKCIDSESSSEC